MSGLASVLLSLAVLGAFALVGGGLYLLVTGKARKQGGLMLVAALVLFANVLIWTL